MRIFASPLPTSARTCSSGTPVARAAEASGSNAATASSSSCASYNASARVRAPSSRARSSVATPLGEEAGVDSEAVGKPFDRALGRARLAALDLRDVLLGEAVAGELALRQPRGDAKLAKPFPETKSLGVGPASRAAGGFSCWHVSARWSSQAHTSLQRNLLLLAIPRSSVFRAKIGQPWEAQNHLTEVLDSCRKGSYSEPTLQPGRTPGRGSQGARWDSRRGRETGGPQIRLLGTPSRVARLSRRPRSRSRGLFIGPAPPARVGRKQTRSEGLDQPRSQARRAARMAESSSSSRRPTRLPTMPRIPPASMIHASESGSRSAAIAPCA